MRPKARQVQDIARLGRGDAVPRWNGAFRREPAGHAGEPRAESAEVRAAPGGAADAASGVSSAGPTGPSGSA
jgi:hypothetical protein